MATLADIETIVAAYVECALWASYDDDGNPLDDWATADDIDASALAEITREVADFVEAQSADLAGIAPDMIGHDFFLTRNGHGAGFWDRGYGAIGERLTKATKPYGSQDLYVGDDGRIYVA